MSMRISELSRASGVPVPSSDHAAQAAAYFDETADAFTEADAVNSAMYAAILRAQALASCGDAVRAQAQLVEIDHLARVQPSNAWKHAVDIEVARALVDAVAGRTSAAVDRLLAVASFLTHPPPELTILPLRGCEGRGPRTLGCASVLLARAVG